jgi:hypothetical protein
MRWWPFGSRRPPRQPLIVLGELREDPGAYDVLTVGQSRLGESFSALGLTEESGPLFRWCRIEPIMDERMNVAADVTVMVDGQLVGYLRPPALYWAMAARDRHHADHLEVPAVLEWGPAGPEVRLRGLSADGN